MRKDEIEDRIVRLEQEFRSFKADHRDGVDTILSEMQKLSETAIEDRITDMRERIVEGYQSIVMDILLKNAAVNLDAQCLDPCVRNRRKECREFLLARLRVAAQKVQDPDLVLPPGRETMSDRQLLKKAPFLSDGPCNTCFSAYLHEKEQLEDSVGRLREGMDSLAVKRKGIYLSELPDDIAISTLLEPLSHESRFMMLRALANGSMSFSELAALTGSRGGHLLYHLGKLMDAGFVMKSDAGKRYAITDRGLGVMDLVKKLYART